MGNAMCGFRAKGQFATHNDSGFAMDKQQRLLQILDKAAEMVEKLGLAGAVPRLR
jgi:hypothetical protein